MKCPHCQETLHMTQREGIEIDYCPECRGVWLDRGELDKIIERSGTWTASGGDAPRAEAPRGDDPRGRKSRGSFIGDLFEGFGG